MTLREIPNIKQYPGEPRRRWFAAETMDLFVWFSESGDIVAFQLAYDKPHAERAISWKSGKGFSHTRVDDGANPGGHPGTPLLVEDGSFDTSRVLAAFQSQASGIDQDIVRFISLRLKDYTPPPGPPARDDEGPYGSVRNALLNLIRTVSKCLRNRG